MQGATPAAKMEVKTSLLDNMIGVGDMVLLEPLSEDSFIENLRNRFHHNEIYVSLYHIHVMKLYFILLVPTSKDWRRPSVIN